jgi:antitoxin component YwqK of YwqJK toxin-antitoxin module
MCEGQWVKGNVSGEWIEYYDAPDKIRNKGNYVGGKKEGMWEYRHENGKVSKAIDYRNDDWHGSYKEWYESGNLMCEGQWVKGNVSGEWIEYYDAPDKIGKKGNYVDGKQEGMWEYRYENGKLRKVIHYRNDDRHGSYKEWHESGNLRYEGQYVKGNKSGEWIEYYDAPDKIRNKGNYVDGKQEDRWVLWHENGKVSNVIYYRNNDRHGNYKEWYKSGNLRYEGQYVKGNKSGQWIQWHDTGGRIRDKGSYVDGHKEGQWIYCRDDGTPEKVALLKAGILEKELSFLTWRGEEEWIWKDSGFEPDWEKKLGTIYDEIMDKCPEIIPRPVYKSVFFSYWLKKKNKSVGNWEFPAPSYSIVDGDNVDPKGTLQDAFAKAFLSELLQIVQGEFWNNYDAYKRLYMKRAKLMCCGDKVDSGDIEALENEISRQAEKVRDKRYYRLLDEVVEDIRTRYARIRRGYKAGDLNKDLGPFQIKHGDQWADAYFVKRIGLYYQFLTKIKQGNKTLHIKDVKSASDVRLVSSGYTLAEAERRIRDGNLRAKTLTGYSRRNRNVLQEMFKEVYVEPEDLPASIGIDVDTDIDASLVDIDGENYKVLLTREEDNKRWIITLPPEKIYSETKDKTLTKMFEDEDDGPELRRKLARILSPPLLREGEAEPLH